MESLIFLLLALLIPFCCWLVYRCGARDGEKKALTLAVYPTPVHLNVDPALIAAVLAAEGWTVTRPDKPAAPVKPH